MTQKSSKQAVLAAMLGTPAQIVARSGISRATVYHWIRILRAEAECFIKSWRRTTGCTAPYFVAGQGVDAVKPSARTGAEYSHRHYIRHRAALEAELRAARKVARESAARAAERPNTWFSALGGAC